VEGRSDVRADDVAAAGGRVDGAMGERGAADDGAMMTGVQALCSGSTIRKSGSSQKPLQSDPPIPDRE
jgi:hypothetical protein